MEFELNQYGYITKYLVSGLKEQDISFQADGRDQLECERQMRYQIVPLKGGQPQGEIRIGKDSALGLPWNYMYTYGSWFVDMSKFYPLLKKLELHGAVVLKVPYDMEVELWLWSYGAVSLWINGVFAGAIDHPCYKPIQRKKMKVALKEGENLLYIGLRNLGVRDTRTLFGIQIPGFEKELLRVSLPHIEEMEEYIKADNWLSAVRLREGRLLFSHEAPVGSRIVYDAKPIDFEDFGHRYISRILKGEKEVFLEDQKPYLKVEVPVGTQILSRTFERHELFRPQSADGVQGADRRKKICQRIASVGQIPRGDSESFSMYPILARYYMGQVRPEDEQEIYKSLKQIESRRDCSDFLTCALVRFLKLYPVKPDLADRCREVMLNYRYWMDEKGSDGMCFWSENHSLMFFVTAYLIGEIYPDSIFVRAGKKGHELRAEARKRIYDWMEDVISIGFDEFHSGGYMPITFAAILNVIDFADEELSSMAWKAADRLFNDLAYQTFQGVSVAPMGRVYREVLYPFAQDIQCLVNLADEEAPDRFSEWIVFLATSRYQLPEGLKERMRKPLSLVYEESNARIRVERKQEYILTSVESPRRDGVKRVWENIYGSKDACQGSFKYAKSLNECFHGTVQFEPGVLGYQQHLWYAALSQTAVVFVNHPGGSCESCSTRPGYWFGNGCFPALKQERNLLYAVYKIPKNHPIPFTHVYWPRNRFKKQLMVEGWLVGQAGDGYIGLWCNEELIPYDDWLAECEYRVQSREAAYVCVCESQKQFKDLKEFVSYLCQLKPVYKNGILQAGKDGIRYKEYENRTQYI